MIKEEIIKHLHEALNSVDITFPYRYVLVEAIEALSQSSLPSNLYEAAQKVEDYYDVGEEHGYLYCHHGDIKDAFKAGVEWCNAQIPKLPDNIDEAAAKYADTQNKNFLKPEIVKNIFKAGVEWMAGQGQTFAAHFDDGYGCAVASGVKLPFVLWNTYKDGDVLKVQIRKK